MAFAMPPRLGIGGGTWLLFDDIESIMPFTPRRDGFEDILMSIDGCPPLILYIRILITFTLRASRHTFTSPEGRDIEAHRAAF